MNQVSTRMALLIHNLLLGINVSTPHGFYQDYLTLTSSSGFIESHPLFSSLSLSSFRISLKFSNAHLSPSIPFTLSFSISLFPLFSNFPTPSSIVFPFQLARGGGRTAEMYLKIMPVQTKHERFRPFSTPNLTRSEGGYHVLNLQRQAYE